MVTLAKRGSLCVSPQQPLCYGVQPNSFSSQCHSQHYGHLHQRSCSVSYLWYADSSTGYWTSFSEGVSANLLWQWRWSFDGSYWMELRRGRWLNPWHHGMQWKHDSSHYTWYYPLHIFCFWTSCYLYWVCLVWKMETSKWLLEWTSYQSLMHYCCLASRYQMWWCQKESCQISHLLCI